MAPETRKARWLWPCAPQVGLSGNRGGNSVFGAVASDLERLARPHRLLAREDPLDLGGRRKGIAFVPQAMG